jgi:hypothetical protein
VWSGGHTSWAPSLPLGPFRLDLFPLHSTVETTSCILWNAKIPRKKRGSLPLKSINSSPSPSSPSHSLHSLTSLVHPLPCHGSLQCSVHRCRCKEDPTVEGGTTHQGHVVCFGRINRPRGLRCCEGGYWRSRRAISEDGRPAGHGLWPFDPS